DYAQLLKTLRLVTPPPPSRFFRISRLRNFSLQHIEPQWFTAKFFHCHIYRLGFPLTSTLWGRKRQAGYSTGNRAATSFPAGGVPTDCPRTLHRALGG